MFLKVLSLIMILQYLYIASLINPYSIGIIMILCGSMTYTCNKNLETNCGAVFLLMVILRQLLAIGD